LKNDLNILKISVYKKSESFLSRDICVLVLPLFFAEAVDKVKKLKILG
jgi:hypothetical protein